MVTTPTHKPPDPPPDIRDTEISEAFVPRPSFLETLMRDQERARARQPSVDLIEAQVVRMEFVKGNRLHPSFELEKEYFKQLCAPWRESLILKLLGRDIGYKALYSRLVHLWKLVGRFELLDLGHGERMEQDREVAPITDFGDWMIARQIRRPPRNKPPAAESHSTGPSNGNRFAALSYEQMVDEGNRGQPSMLKVSDVMRVNNPRPKHVRAKASPGPFSFFASPKEQPNTSSQKEPASSPAQVGPSQSGSEAILKPVPTRGKSKISRGPSSAPLVSSSPPLVSPVSSSLPPMAPSSSSTVGLPPSPPLVFGLAAFNPKASSAVLEPKPPDDAVDGNEPRFSSVCPPPGSPLESFVEASDQLSNPMDA
ncbi:hypothetical protein Tsubulata_049655 [Turnera subulata]|uniref:DUF4283 domain-containing protein n=1 Tax=Turnera subulata TaxID=218843 RepID=A0A9Q0FN51_9ROSI|nr:hypothetical protein Tsubulata_049655 [Turnera subulata]